MKIIDKKYIRAAGVQEALDIARHNNRHARFIAGGTDVMVNKQQGNENSEVLIDISDIHELKGINVGNEFVSIGPLVSLEEITKSAELRKLFPALCDAARSVGTPLIRATATIGGNVLCENRCLYYNQSEWWREAVGYCLKCEGDICIATGGPNACFSELVADTVPVLVSMEAKIRYFHFNGEEKFVLLKDIYTGNGVRPRLISNTDLVTELVIPANKGFRCVFNKLRLRESLEFTSLSSSVSIDNEGKIRIALAGVDPKPVYLETHKGETVEEVVKKLLKLSRAVDNDVFSRNYRRDMVKVFIEKSYKELGLI